MLSETKVCIIVGLYVGSLGTGGVMAGARTYSHACAA